MPNVASNIWNDGKFSIQNELIKIIKMVDASNAFNEVDDDAATPAVGNDGKIEQWFMYQSIILYNPVYTCTQIV